MELVVSKWIRLAVSGRCRHGQWRRARLATGSLSGAERFASLPVLTQLAGFGFKDLSPVTQGRAEGLDDLRPRRPLDGHAQGPGGGVQGEGHDAFQLQGKQLVLLGPGCFAGPADLPQLFAIPHGRSAKWWRGKRGAGGRA